MGSKHVLIIAEAGVNHNGSLERALEMIDAAAQAGADIVKFQTFRADSIASAQAKKADYQNENAPESGDSQLEMLRELELDEAAHEKLMARCRERGIEFLSTAFDLGSVDLLERLGIKTWKVPSGEITNLPLLRRIGATGGRAIVSTGMCTLEEVENAVRVLESYGIPRGRITLLQCTTQYPAPMESANLRAMDSLRALGCAGVGLSDHTPGITASIAAAARGAEVIEKHFTLSRTLPGPDHIASLEPHELKALVDAVRDVEKALGSDVKTVSDAERPNIAVARKSIVAARNISRGELLDEANLTTKRPGTGISPMLWDSVVGTRAVRDFAKDEMIEI